MRTLPWSRLVLTLALGCAPLDESGESGDAGDPDAPGNFSAPGLAAPRAPCALDPASPRRLLVTTTDFSTGALSVVDLVDGTVTADVAMGSTDAIPVAAGDRAFMLHRFGIDRIDELDADTFALRAQVPVPREGDARPNPHALALGPDGTAFVALFSAPRIEIFDLASASPHLGTIDLLPVADDDGNPEATGLVACGGVAYVVLEHLDDHYLSRGADELVALDLVARTVLDADPERPGVQGLRLLGTWTRQLRRDPADPSGATWLGLSTGIARIDVGRGETTWAVPASAFAAEGLSDPLLLQSFDVDDSGHWVYVAAYTPDYGEVQLWRAELDGGALEPFAAGYDSVERTLEVVGDALWYGSTRPEAPGLWRFDLRVDPPRPDPAPLSLGLPPYSLTVLP